MKTWLFLLFAFLIPAFVFAQKNVIPASQIPTLNLKLPEGSKQDKRFLSTVTAASLLETEVNDPNVSLSEVEVYTLPPTPQSGFDAEVLVAELEKSGFEILPTQDDRIAWLVKGQTAYLIYFSMDKTETNFYLGKSNTVPKPTQSQQVQQGVPTSPQPTVPAYIPPLPPSRSSTSPSVNQQAPAPNPPATYQSQAQNPPSNSSALKTPVAPFTGFQFTTSNFDDGWISSIQPDWVLVQKEKQRSTCFLCFPTEAKISVEPG